jgi:hypothetical protein
LKGIKFLFCFLFILWLLQKFCLAESKWVEGSAGFSYSYDDNVTYNPIRVAEGVDQKTTTFLRLTFNYQPLAFNLSGYRYLYAKNQEFNSQGVVLGLKWSHQTPKGIVLSLMSDFSFFKKDGQDYYDTYYYRLHTTFKPASLGWTMLYFGYLIGDYRIEVYKPLSYRETSLGFRHYLIGNLSFFVELSQSLAERGDYSYSAKEIGVHHFFTLPGGIECSISDQYLWKDFLSEDYYAGIIRHDQKNSFEIYFSKRFWFDFALGLRYQFIVNRSNLSKENSVLGYGSYEESIVSAALSKFF